MVEYYACGQDKAGEWHYVVEETKSAAIKCLREKGIAGIIEVDKVSVL